MNVILSLDIGGTKINSAVVDARSFRIVQQLDRIPSQPPHSNINNQTLKAVDALVAAANTARHKPVACGAVVAGQVQWPTGTVRWGSNIHLAQKTVALRGQLERRTHIPTTVDNDVHGFLAAEVHQGFARGKHVVAAVNLGTGIGGAIAIDGEILRGPDNTTGEFGHMMIAMDGTRECGDGMMGHFEAYASGTALGGARELEQQVLRCDPKAKKFVEQTQNALAVGLANIVVSLNPDCIVIGGGLARFTALLNGLEKKVYKKVPFPTKSRILTSRLGDDAQLIGAAILASSGHPGLTRIRS